jgi:tripartite-type tricarboxylate transporter receptor subunit TctC
MPDIQRFALIAAASVCSMTAVAQNYPAKSVRVVIALGPGGSVDAVTRIFAKRLADATGQQFIVENRPGAGSIPGYTYVAKSPPDGYTLLAAGLTFSSSFALREDVPIDPLRDFAAVSLMTKAPWLLLVNPSVPARSVRELVSLAKARPGMLNFAGGALGAGTHLLSLWFFQAANVKAAYIPYSTGGTAQSTIDTVAGRADATIVTYLTAKPFLTTGKLRALGISSAQPSRVLPDVPPIAQQGVPGFDAYTFNGWVAPAGTPAAVLNRLSQELATIAKSPEIQERIIDDAGEPVGSTPEQFRAFLQSEVTRWRRLAKESGIKIDQ